MFRWNPLLNPPHFFLKSKVDLLTNQGPKMMYLQRVSEAEPVAAGAGAAAELDQSGGGGRL